MERLYQGAALMAIALCSGCGDVRGMPRGEVLIGSIGNIGNKWW